MHHAFLFRIELDYASHFIVSILFSVYFSRKAFVPRMKLFKRSIAVESIQDEPGDISGVIIGDGGAPA